MLLPLLFACPNEKLTVTGNANTVRKASRTRSVFVLMATFESKLL
jgi:hypothetical protein